MNQNIIIVVGQGQVNLFFQKNNQQLNKYFIDNKKMTQDKWINHRRVLSLKLIIYKYNLLTIKPKIFSTYVFFNIRKLRIYIYLILLF